MRRFGRYVKGVSGRIFHYAHAFVDHVWCIMDAMAANPNSDIGLSGILTLRA